MIRIIVLIILFGVADCFLSDAAEYAVVHTSAPVLHSPDFKAIFGGTTGHQLKTDHCGQVRELEYIALPGTVVRILEKSSSGTDTIYRIETDEYTAPPNIRLYIDGRFLRREQTAPIPRKPSLPSREAIESLLQAAVGSPYVWGGNSMTGVLELGAWFYKEIQEHDRTRLTLAGLDCSGLLYHATGGWTPRNTSQLITFGQGVTISGKQPPEIAALLQPLDLIVWNGHVIIVLDRQTVIESRLECGKPGNGGVLKTPLSQRISEIMRTRIPANAWPFGEKHQNVFVVRRWYVQ